MDDTKKFPNYGNSRRKMEVKQRRGEVIFVPSGWHHQVFNLVIPLSVFTQFMSFTFSLICPNSELNKTQFLEIKVLP